MSRLVASLLLVAVLPVTARADAPPRRELRHSLGMSVNNVGLQDSLELSWTWRDRVGLALNPVLSPSYGRIGAWARLEPHPAFELGAGVEPAAYFGTFSSLKSFERYSDPFDAEARGEVESRFGIGGRACVAPRLRLKAGPVIALAGADLEWWWSNADGPYFYEPARDTLLRASGDRLLTTSAALLVRRGRGDGGSLSLGLNHGMVYVFDAPSNRVHRLGAVVIRELGGKRLGLRRPTLLASVYYYLRDPSKRGQIGAAAGVSVTKTR